jgi:voltage-gated potassium channel
MNKKIRQPLGAILPTNLKIKRIIEAIIIILIVSDIILVTSLYFINVSLYTYYTIVIFDTVLCVILFVDFMLKMWPKENKMQYIKDNRSKVIIDIVSMIPYELLAFGPFGFIKLLRLVRIISLLGKGKRNIFNFLQKTKLNYLVFTFIIIICAGSLTLLVLEDSPTDKINSPIDAVWYVMATLSTVGYGDVTPESFGGKLIGIVLMIVGVGFFSILTATFSSWFMRDLESEEEEIKDKIISIESSINELKSEMKEIKELIKNK